MCSSFLLKKGPSFLKKIKVLTKILPSVEISPMWPVGCQKETSERAEGFRRLWRRPVWSFFVAPLIVKDYTWESKYIFTSHVSGHWAVFKETRIWHTPFLLGYHVSVQFVIVLDWVIFRTFVFGLTWCLERFICIVLIIPGVDGCFNVEHDSVLYRIFFPR